MKFLLDTNLALRLVDSENHANQMAFSFLVGLIKAGHRPVLAHQVLYESWSVLTRPLDKNGSGLSSTAACAVLESLRSTYPLLPDPPDMLDRWLRLCRDHDVKGRQAHDARLAAWMDGHGVPALATFNPVDFRRYPHITIFTP